MNRSKRYAVLILAFVVCLLALTGCASKKAGLVMIYSAEHLEEYTDAATKHFSAIGWSKGNYANDNLSEPTQVGNVRIDPPRYAVVISEEEEILDSEPIEGKLYSIFVYDNGSDDIKITMCYSVGTTDNCVVQGNVTSGEFAYNNSLDIAASGNSDASKRASLIFNALYEALVDIEGK